jgi:orotate phosphoribosyltransferase
MSKVNISLCLEMLKLGIRNSWYIYSSGQPAHTYANVDIMMLGDDYSQEDIPQYKRIENVTEQLIIKIQEIDEEESFDRLAFIDKAGHGPVGMIALSSLLIYRLQKDALYLRPYRNTLRSTTKGKRLRTNEKVLIISDVATTGETILKAARTLWDSGAIARGVLVYFDQELGAKENLKAQDIKLYSLVKRSDDTSLISDTKEVKELQEFGGVM